ncbi:GNAT family N-acetyltransferase [Aneurinibacillus tyrosinisolvens]|uniref:GNAT family N-acetyltransferase n=1 Tax=Aneurinibacillus tyrosinisolvens TaxID=1443435 RepID=UPI00063FCE17|nr:GNAT family N-acetyltransferase [Aneurinibacillus tyrosinisolvens]
MLDKTIPYHGIILCRKAGTPIPKPALPKGYSFVSFFSGDERAWAEIETSVGEFENIGDALACFQENYLLYPAEVKRRTIFIQSENGEKMATLTNWWGYTEGRRDPWIHWVAVKPGYQGLGLGKALVLEGMYRMLQLEGNRDIYLPTQTWSYKAIGIYLKAGFDFINQDKQVMDGFINEYKDAMCVLRTKMNVAPNFQ